MPLRLPGQRVRAHIARRREARRALRQPSGFRIALADTITQLDRDQIVRRLVGLAHHAEAPETTTVSGGRPKPLYVGQTWSTTYTTTCGASVTSDVESGTVTSAESVTVAAGTFASLKLSYSLAWSTTTGQDIVEHDDVWTDPAHGFCTLKRETTYQRMGNVPAHYVVSQTAELQSRH